MLWSEVRILGTLSLMLLIPGWVILAITGNWRRWDTLQRWCIAIGLSIALYPVVFYAVRLLPDFRIGMNKVWVGLITGGLIILWKMRHAWRQQFSFKPLEWMAIFIFLATLFARFWMAHLYPYPAWSDSLHHTLLTQMVADKGRLPWTLEPYEPARLDMYHLGLYSLSGTLQLLARVPAFTALLWVVQALNGLAGLGVYLVLDRWVGRYGAILGCLVVGFLSFQPAWYFNWGRDTQLASQTILLMAWLLSWEAMALWRNSNRKENAFFSQISLLAIAGVFNAGVFMLHYRVAGFYLPILFCTGVIEGYRALKSQKIYSWLGWLTSAGLFSLILVLPSLLPAIQTYWSTHSGPATPILSLQASRGPDPYYDFPFNSLFELGVHPWLLGLTVIGVVIGVLGRNGVVLLSMIWALLLWGEGHFYLLGIPQLKFTNLGAVLIQYYLQISLILGGAFQTLVKHFQGFLSERLQKLFPGFVFVVVLLGLPVRISGIESYRFFFTDDDLRAMTWIRENTPSDSVFAINTYLWLGNSPHGTDGGYWIPYFTGRKTTTGTMLYSLGPKEYVQKVISVSKVVNEISSDPLQVRKLCSLGVDYLYIGQKGNFSGEGFNPLQIKDALGVDPVYSYKNVYIFEVCPK